MPTKPKILIIWPVTEKVCQTLLQGKNDVQSQEGTLGTKSEVKLRVHGHRSEGEQKILMVLDWMARMSTKKGVHSGG